MSTRTSHTSTARLLDHVSVTNFVIALGIALLLAIYGSVTLGIVSIGLAPTFIAWLLAVGILGASPVVTVWLISWVIELVE